MWLIPKKFRKNLVYFWILLIIVVIAYAINFFSVGDRSQKFAKEELRETFKGITGRTPNKEEKASFWGESVGDKNPSKVKKDEYWQNE